MKSSGRDASRFFSTLVPLLKKEYRRFREPIVTEISRRERDPFQVLISTVLSLRTQDATTAQASRRLFNVAVTPLEMEKLPVKRIERLIYPVGFYKVKARHILGICQKLLTEYHEKVPSTLEELLAFKGVGRKTANLVLTRGFNLPGICVDTHVHRISNRLGVLRTKTPEETEMVLRKILPGKYWIDYNDLLVAYGQNVCRPLGPLCSRCAISRLCRRVGVKRSR